MVGVSGSPLRLVLLCLLIPAFVRDNAVGVYPYSVFVLAPEAVIPVVDDLTTLGMPAVYYGTEIGSLSTLQHLVSGTVYAVSADILRIVNFNYDGLGPAGRFFVGTASGAPAVGGTTIPDENGSTNKLGVYTNQTIFIKLPAEINMDNLTWFSVWCNEFSADFGHVTFPVSFSKPGPVSLGQFGLSSPSAHNFSSGDVTVIDSKTISIKAIYYDGLGPDAFFILDNDTTVGHSGYDKLKDENNSTSKVKAYTGQDIVLVLPSGISVTGDYKSLSLYCITASQNFGHLDIPSQLNVPLHPDTLQEETMDGSSEMDNCESMGSDFNVGWSVNTTHITFEFVSALADGRYMSFGLSGSDSGVAMVGGDVIIARYADGNPYAEDYYLQAYAQCSAGSGACPDTMSGGNQDARVIGGSKVDGVVRVMVTRALDTGDSTTNKVYTPNVEQQIIWGLGGLNTETFVTKHDQRITESKKIMFGRTPERNCGSIVAASTPSGEVWQEQRLSGRDTKTFYVSIGPPAGDKGYKAITGQQSWGIAYYINGFLIPRLELRRGDNFTFIIEAGYDTTNVAKYHPFYLTTDPRGGYTQQTQQERDQYKDFLGIDTTTKQPVPDAVGRYCEYTSSGGLEAETNSRTFAEYKETLTYSCEKGPENRTEAGTLKFYADYTLPDRLYYQCFTHFRLGHIIDIVDDYSSGFQPLSSIPFVISSILISLITMRLTSML